MKLSFPMLFASGVLTVCRCLTTRQPFALESIRRPAAYRALSTTRTGDRVSAALAGTELMEQVVSELEEIGRLQGMRAVYNQLESVCVVDHWLHQHTKQFFKKHPETMQIVLFKSGMSALPYVDASFTGRVVYEVDLPIHVFLKKQMLNGSKERFGGHVSAVKQCLTTFEQDGSVTWFASLTENGWKSQEPTLFMMQDLSVADSFSMDRLEKILELMQAYGAVTFSTARMQGNKQRIERWLQKIGFKDFTVHALADKAVHEGALSPSDPRFENRWLVFCQYS